MLDDPEDTTDLFRRRTALKPRHTPDDTVARDSERRAIAETIGAATRGDPVDHVLAYGPAGQGKTAICRRVVGDLGNERGVDTVWLDCATYSTRTAVLTQIAAALGEVRAKRGLGADYLLDRLEQWLEYDRRHNIVVGLDQVNWLEAPDRTLQDLHRLGIDSGRAVGLVLVTTAEPADLSWDRATWGRLQLREICFDPYSRDELYEIVEPRVREAFKDGVITEAAVQEAVDVVVEETLDVRQVLAVLKRAGELAEQSGADGVTNEYVAAAWEPDRF